MTRWAQQAFARRQREAPHRLVAMTRSAQQAFAQAAQQRDAPHRPTATTRRAHRAFTLLELLIVLAILGAVSVWQLQRRGQELEQRLAMVAATRLARYADALAQHIGELGAGTPAGQYTGSAWLKGRTDCPGVGQGSHARLPCAFPDTLPFGLRYHTTVSNSVGVVRATVRIRPAPLRVRGRVRADLAATMVAEAIARADQAVHFALSARNEITASYNSQVTADRFLRIDGGNHMQANLDLHGNSLVAGRNLAFGQSLLHSNGNTDSIELGGRGGAGIVRGGTQGNTPQPGTGRPHIDFHHGNRRQEDFNVRLSNFADGALRVQNSAGREVSLLDLPGQVVQGLSIVSNGAQVPKPRCSAGLSPQIFLMPSSFIGTLDGTRRRTVAGLRSWAADLGASAWRAHFQILPEGQNWTSSDAQLLALTKCT